jgi:hypothetical protein
LASCTQVTITGSGFAPGSTVSFGAAAASSVSYVAENTLLAVSPPGAEGQVHVTVTTPGGTSAANPASLFQYVPGSSPSSSSGGSVLAFGASGSAGALPCASLASRTIYVVSGGRAQVRLRRAPAGTCRGRLVLSVRTRVREHGRIVLRTRTVAVGGFTVSAGRLRIQTVRFNALGRGLFRAGHGRLSARIVLQPRLGVATSARAISVNVLLRTAPPPRRH